MAGVILCLAVAWSHMSIGIASGQQQQPTQELTNTFCPVLEGEAVDPNIYVDFEGQRVYLCCRMCKRDFLEDPEQFREALAQVMPASFQETPVSDDVALQAPPQKPNPALNWIGRWHPIAAHFPIGLIITGALLLVISSFRPRWTTGKGGAKSCIFLGTIAAVGTAVLGLINNTFSVHPEATHDLREVHEWAGLAAAGISLVAGYLLWTAACAECAGGKGHRLPTWVTVGASVLAAIAVAVTGHFGASIVYGTDYLWPF
ncbi:MAG: hypothetical protein D8M59_15240 [Planctomycetes bacterium]|nr:hypothetical protein [Planctomycetota bacterium]